MKKLIADKLSKARKDIHLKELLKGSTVAFVFKVLSMGMNFIFSWLVAFFWGADTFGRFSIAFAVVTIFSIIGKSGFDTALLKLISQYHSQGKNELIRPLFNKALFFVIPFSILLSSVMYFASPFFAETIFHKPYLASYIKIFSLCITPMVLIFIYSESLRGLKRIMEYSLLQKGLYYLLASLILLLGWVAVSKTDTVVFVSFIAALYASIVIGHFQWIKASPVSSGNEKRSENMSMKNLLLLAFPMLLPSALSFIQSWTDTIILGMYRNEAEVGVYNVALRLASLSSIALAAINSISAPKFSALHAKGDMANFAKVAQQSTKMIFFTSFPILLCFMFIPSFILGIYGAEFKAGAWALIFISIGQFISAVSGSVGIILLMSNNQVVFQYVILFTSSLNIVLNLLLIPKFGMNGAAISNMVALSLANIICVYVIYRKFGIFVAYIPFLSRKNVHHK